MPAIRSGLTLARVNETPTDLAVHIVRSGGAIRGTVARSDDVAESFSGWLEFTAAVSRLIAAEESGGSDAAADRPLSR